TGTVRALAAPRPFPLERASRIVKTRGVLQAREEPGTPNARTLIDRREPRPGISAREGRAMCRYVLTPATGKTHQLRVHMDSLGLPIAGDDLYPRVRDVAVDDFSHPLQLVARTLEFTDPFTGKTRRFVSRIPLAG
ncbi:MAG: 23S rRNA pseudouridylate synthase, partial [Bifidobacterium sp.]|nr:23S rRNA pseudouridylate synthase [Bifidobacterium sp.]